MFGLYFNANFSIYNVNLYVRVKSGTFYLSPQLLVFNFSPVSSRREIWKLFSILSKIHIQTYKYMLNNYRNIKLHRIFVRILFFGNQKSIQNLTCLKYLWNYHHFVSINPQFNSNNKLINLHFSLSENINRLTEKTIKGPIKSSKENLLKIHQLLEPSIGSDSIQRFGKKDDWK